MHSSCFKISSIGQLIFDFILIIQNIVTKNIRTPFNSIMANNFNWAHINSDSNWTRFERRIGNDEVSFFYLIYIYSSFFLLFFTLNNPLSHYIFFYLIITNNLNLIKKSWNQWLITKFQKFLANIITMWMIYYFE